MTKNNCSSAIVAGFPVQGGGCSALVYQAGASGMLEGKWNVRVWCRYPGASPVPAMRHDADCQCPPGSTAISDPR